MKQRYWLFKRGRVYYLQDADTGKQQSLRTKNQVAAERLWHAKLESVQQPALNLQLGKTYLSAHDPKMPNRTWGLVMEKAMSRGKEPTRARWHREIKSQPFELIRDQKLIETTADDFFRVLDCGKVSTNVFLRALQNLAIGLGWLPWPIIPQRLWPKARCEPKRAITLEEHQLIIAAEKNPERRRFYELLWEIGASQTDAVALRAENLNWRSRTLTYQRRKTGTRAYLTIGAQLEALFRQLPPKGPLFPHLVKTKDSDRSSEFYRRCKLCGISGISLHSYRYAWAERAKAAGYPERFAMEALGHNSRAIHEAYAKAARTVCPSLEEYECRPKENVVVVDFQAANRPTRPENQSSNSANPESVSILEFMPP